MISARDGGRSVRPRLAMFPTQTANPPGLATVNLATYLHSQPHFTIVGYGDARVSIDAADFARNLTATADTLARIKLDANGHWNPDGSVCIDMLRVGIGSTWSALQKSRTRR